MLCRAFAGNYAAFRYAWRRQREIRQAQNGRQETSLSNLVQAISAARVRRRDEGCRI